MIESLVSVEHRNWTIIDVLKLLNYLCSNLRYDALKLNETCAKISSTFQFNYDKKDPYKKTLCFNKEVNGRKSSKMILSM